MVASGDGSEEDMQPCGSRSLPCSDVAINSMPRSRFEADCSQMGSVSTRAINVFSTLEACSHAPMIHVDVPDTQTLVEKSDGTSKYVAYDIHVNGWYHANVRFSHLYAFAESIKQRFPQKYKGPEFPAKKLFKLSPRDVEDRRSKITKYFAALVQYPDIIRNYMVEKKFLEFQVDSYRATSSHVTVEIFKGDGEKVVLKCNVSDNMTGVMKALATKLGFANSDRFLWNFGLFMARNREAQSLTCSVSSDNFDPLLVRLLRNYEAPYISLQSSNQKSAAAGIYHFLVIRKLVWDPRTEESLMDDTIIVDLLYRQAVQYYKNGHLGNIRSEIDSKLSTLLQKADKIQFLRACHTLPLYSYEILTECMSDYPQDNTVCNVKIGRRQIVLTYKDGSGTAIDSLFRATRIRLWRISQNLTSDEFTFQFEYLVARDSFEWITLHTDQAVLLSLLLQSVGSEILYEQTSIPIEHELVDETRVTVDPVPVNKDKSCPDRPVVVLKNAVEPSDPLGVMEYYRTRTRMYNTISENLPKHNDTANITDDDL